MKNNSLNILILTLSFFVLQTKTASVSKRVKRIVIYETFEAYKKFFHKIYARDYEETRSRKAYEENVNLIKDHNILFNKGSSLFMLRANDLADLNNDQYLKRYVRLETNNSSDSDTNLNPEVVALASPANASEIVPDFFDWRDMGFLTKPDNQGSCGSCYAYSIAQTVEGQIFKRTGKLLSLSEQQIVDCSSSVGNHGCKGGSLRNTLKYLEAVGGLMRRTDYPYVTKEGKCQFVKELTVTNVTSWAILPPKDEEAIKIAVATIGPVAISINAAPKTFQLYSEGVYDDNDCISTKVNHAMLVVGYSPDYWILKNWWGKNWGDDGYMKIKRHKNLCGLANFAAYAVV